MSATTARPEGWRLVSIIAAAVVAAVASILAVVSLRSIVEPALVDVAVPPSAIATVDGVAGGTIRAGLPPFERHWDGQPPSAVLVSPSTGAVLAAAAFSDGTFDRNLSAVRFVDGEARFRLDARRWSPGAPLALRIEAVQSRGRFILWSSVAAIAALAFMVLIAIGGRGLHLAGSLVFIAVATSIFTSVYPGAPIRIDEVTDEASINSYAAARDHPDRFALDKLLSVPDNYTWYSPVYVNTVRAFHRLGFHYQTANAFLGGGAALLLLCGLRRLFLKISGRQGLALAGALALGLMFEAGAPPAGEFWSITGILPRTIFAAFVPWVILLALACAPSPRRWWIACAAAGLVLHIHPLSGPVLAGALLTAFVLSSDEPIAARSAGTALAIAALALTALPFAIVYLRHYTPAHIDAATATRALALTRLTFADLRVGLVARQLMAHRIMTLRIVLDGLAIVLLWRSPFDKCVRFYLGLCVGFAIMTFGFPVADSAVAAYLDRRQLAYELPRNVRYLDLLMAGALAVGVRGWRGSRPQALGAIAMAAVCASIALGPGWLLTARLIAGRTRLSWRILNGHPDLESGAAQEAIRAVRALRDPSARVSGPVGLRQFGVPIAWIARDITAQSYSVSPGLLESADVVSRADAVFAGSVTADSIARLAPILDAELFLVRVAKLDRSFEASVQVLFANHRYAIVAAAAPLHAASGRVSRSTAREIVAGATATP